MKLQQNNKSHRLAKNKDCFHVKGSLHRKHTVYSSWCLHARMKLKQELQAITNKLKMGFPEQTNKMNFISPSKTVSAQNLRNKMLIWKSGDVWVSSQRFIHSFDLGVFHCHFSLTDISIFQSLKMSLSSKERRPNKKPPVLMCLRTLNTHTHYTRKWSASLKSP